MSNLLSQFTLQGRRALITGASGHLGSAMAEALADMGVDLILVDHPNSDSNNLLSKLSSYSDINIDLIKCDFEIEEARTRLIEMVISRYGALNILINNAAFVGTSDLQGWNAPFEMQSLSTWRRALEVNLTTPFHLVQGLHNILKFSLSPSIINIGSIYGNLGPNWDLYDGLNMANPAAYSASKGGLHQLTRWLSTTLAPDIRVNAIIPGGIQRGQDKLFVERFSGRTPLKRMGHESDFIGALIYLASDMSSYVTGQCVNVDGGFSTW